MPLYRRRQPSDYILPFFILIGIGIILILIFKLGSYLISGKTRQLEDKGVLYLVSGRAEIKQWGDENWTNGYDQAVVLEGDELRTAKNSKIIVKFFNGSVIRLDGGTEILIDKLESRGNEDNIVISLKSGGIWAKRTLDETIESFFSVKTNNLVIRSVGTIFDVQYGEGTESVHVMKGKVLVDILEEVGSERTVNFINIGVGQQVEIGQKELGNFRSGGTSDLLAALSDEFKTTPWYRWNISEDKESSVDKKIPSTTGFEIAATDLPVNENVSSINDEPVEIPAEAPEAGALPLAAPVIIRPLEGERNVLSGEVLIEGTVATGTASVEVSNSSDGFAEFYVLKSYKAGDTKWSYKASSAMTNLKPGKNIYRIVAVNKDGAKSPFAEIIITYEVSTAEPPEELIAPSVNTFNGDTKTEIIGGRIVTIKGTVGKWAKAVLVNDYNLSKFVAGSGEWTYFANADYGNLIEGANNFEVYALDIRDRKSPILKFTVTWHEKAPIEAVLAPATPEVPITSEATP